MQIQTDAKFKQTFYNDNKWKVCHLSTHNFF